MRLALLPLLFVACSSDTSGDPAADTTSATVPDAALDSATSDRCSVAGLVWKTANKTTYTSYPEPGSEECIEFSGCEYQGQFAACDDTMPEAWVAAHDIAALYPLGELALHDICIRAGDEAMVVTVVDTCADSDCDGCCSENRGDADALVDLEKYTNTRFGLDDGPIEWADLGPHPESSFDGCN